jgi:hypothetical protein
MERRKQYFYETIHINGDVEIREEEIYQVFEEQTESPTKAEVREIIRILKE